MSALAIRRPIETPQERLLKVVCSASWAEMALADHQSGAKPRFPPGGRSTLMDRCGACSRLGPCGCDGDCVDCMEERNERGFLERLRASRQEGEEGEDFAEELRARWWKRPFQAHRVFAKKKEGEPPPAERTANPAAVAGALATEATPRKWKPGQAVASLETFLARFGWRGSGVRLVNPIPATSLDFLPPAVVAKVTAIMRSFLGRLLPNAREAAKAMRQALRGVEGFAVRRERRSIDLIGRGRKRRLLRVESDGSRHVENRDVGCQAALLQADEADLLREIDYFERTGCVIPSARQSPGPRKSFGRPPVFNAWDPRR